MAEENVATRLKFFLESQGLTNSQFADSCGIPRPTLSQLLSGRNKKISDLLVGQIHSTYPRLSIMWLLFGEGQMMSQEGANEPMSEGISVSQENVATPHIHFGNEAESDEPDDSGFSRDNIEYSDDDRAQIKFQKGNSLNSDVENTKLTDYQSNSAAKRIADLEKQIAQLRAKPRKVVQITVYYDDNTFETFFPVGR